MEKYEQELIDCKIELGMLKETAIIVPKGKVIFDLNSFECGIAVGFALTSALWYYILV